MLLTDDDLADLPAQLAVGVAQLFQQTDVGIGGFGQGGGGGGQDGRRAVTARIKVRGNAGSIGRDAHEILAAGSGCCSAGGSGRGGPTSGAGDVPHGREWRQEVGRVASLPFYHAEGAVKRHSLFFRFFTFSPNFLGL